MRSAPARSARRIPGAAGPHDRDLDGGLTDGRADGQAAEDLGPPPAAGAGTPRWTGRDPRPGPPRPAARRAEGEVQRRRLAPPGGLVRTSVCEAPSRPPRGPSPQRAELLGDLAWRVPTASLATDRAPRLVGSAGRARRSSSCPQPWWWSIIPMASVEALMESGPESPRGIPKAGENGLSRSRSLGAGGGAEAGRPRGDLGEGASHDGGPADHGGLGRHVPRARRSPSAASSAARARPCVRAPAASARPRAQEGPEVEGPHAQAVVSDERREPGASTAIGSGSSGRLRAALRPPERGPGAGARQPAAGAARTPRSRGAVRREAAEVPRQRASRGPRGPARGRLASVTKRCPHEPRARSDGQIRLSEGPPRTRDV